MPKVSIRKPSNAAKASPAAKGKGKPAKAKAASKAKADSRPRADVDAQRKKVAAAVKKGTKMGDIAQELGVTAGRAAYLNMLNEVESGEVASISTNGNEESVAKRIIAARDKQDAHSSWGWISARTGLPEVKVKKLAEEHGGAVKGTHVAKERAEARGPAKTKAKASAKGKGKNPSK